MVWGGLDVFVIFREKQTNDSALVIRAAANALLLRSQLNAKTIFPCWKTYCQKNVNESISVKHALRKARNFAFRCDPDNR